MGTSPEKKQLKISKIVASNQNLSASIIHFPLDSQIIIGEAVDPSGVTFEAQKRLKILGENPQFLLVNSRVAG